MAEKRRMFAQLNFDDALKQSAFYLDLNSRRVPVTFRESLRARHYAIYVRRDGTVSVTIPRRGSFKGAQRFLDSRRSWIIRTLQSLQNRPRPPQVWQDGTEVLCRGKQVPIRVEMRDDGLAIYLESECCGLARNGENFRPVIEQWLRRIALAELPRRTRELAAQHQAPIRRITVRNQRSRWGSCSHHGTISLNWRLAQLPAEVRDYVILHELMHLREMNHSRRFWAHVAAVCPRYREYEQWLKAHEALLGL